MVVADEKFGVRKAGEKQVKGKVGDFQGLVTAQTVSKSFNASKKRWCAL